MARVVDSGRHRTPDRRLKTKSAGRTPPTPSPLPEQLQLDGCGRFVEGPTPTFGYNQLMGWKIAILAVLVGCGGTRADCLGSTAPSRPPVVSEETAAPREPAVPSSDPNAATGEPAEPAAPQRPPIEWDAARNWYISTQTGTPPETMRVVNDEPIARTTVTTARDPEDPGAIWERFEFENRWRLRVVLVEGDEGSVVPELSEFMGTLMFHVGGYPPKAYDSANEGVWAIAQPGNSTACVLALPAYLEEGGPLQCDVLPLRAAAAQPAERLETYRALHYVWKCPGTELPCLIYGTETERTAFEAQVTSPWGVTQIDLAAHRARGGSFDPRRHRSAQRSWQGTVESAGGTVTWFAGEEATPVFIQRPGRRLMGVTLTYSGPETSAADHMMMNGSLGLMVVQNENGFGFARIGMGQEMAEYFSEVGATGVQVPFRWEWDEEYRVYDLPGEWEYAEGAIRPRQASSTATN